jgi:hypothetical protein
MGATWEMGAAWGKKRKDREKEDEMGKGEMIKRRIIWGKEGEDRKKGVSVVKTETRKAIWERKRVEDLPDPFIGRGGFLTTCCCCFGVYSCHR